MKIEEKVEKWCIDDWSVVMCVKHHQWNDKVKQLNYYYLAPMSNQY